MDSSSDLECVWLMGNGRPNGMVGMEGFQGLRYTFLTDLGYLTSIDD